MPLTISGKTTCGKTVVAGCHVFVGTYGVPLEVVLHVFKEKNLVVDWVDFISNAVKEGAKLKGLKSKILSAIGDVYGGKYRSEFKEKLK